MMQIGMYHRDRHARQTPPLAVRRKRNKALQRLNAARTPDARRSARQAAARAWDEWERAWGCAAALVPSPAPMAPVASPGLTVAGALVAIALLVAGLWAAAVRLGVGR